MRHLLTLAITVGLLFPASGNAAGIIRILDLIDDKIVMTPMGFNTFTVNGNPVADGASFTVDETDEPVSFAGAFSSSTQNGSTDYRVFFLEPTGEQQISDKLFYNVTYSNMGRRGDISGTFLSDAETALSGTIGENDTIWNEANGEFIFTGIDVGINATSDLDVPEPPSLLLLVSGLSAGAVWARKKALPKQQLAV
jgi:hypothetical protein